LQNCGSQILKVRNRSSATFFSPQFRNRIGSPQYCGIAEVRTKIADAHLWYMHDDSLSIHPLLPDLTSICPFLRNTTPLFTYLEILLLLFMVRIPIHSCPWFAINCSPRAASPTPRYPTDQVTYLHRRHQQHQPSHLTQVQIPATFRNCFVAALVVQENKQK
jgi:hypothetical protein